MLSTRARAARAGRVPAWLTLGLGASFTLWMIEGLTSDVRASGFERIDPRSSRLDVRAGFVDPRGNDVLARWMCQLEPVSPHDRDGVERIARAVSQLPFVAEVGEPSVMWPDGIDLPLKLRTPAACVMQGSEYAAVADDGTI